MIHKTTRSILSVLLAVLLLVASTPLTPAFAGDGGVSLQSANSERGGLTGDGMKDNPYKIATAADLLEFADKVNNQHQTSAWAELTADIDLSEICSEEEGDSWSPIGTYINSYKGTFDGNEKTISGLYINSSSDSYQGLFGYVDPGGTVKDLTVSGSVSGNNYVGGVVGYNDEGRVENCHNIGEVSGNRYVGGVVGQNNVSSTVENCTNTGSVNGSDHVGGVVGNNEASVENCYNIGKVTGSADSSNVGGVVGWNSSSVENCYNTGAVSGGEYVGGVVGTKEAGASVANCYFLQGTAQKGIGIGSGDATSVTTLDELCEKFENDNTNTWTISDTLNRPVLTSNHEDDGTQAHPYRISTATQLENFRDLVNGPSGQVKDSDAHAKLMNDINLSSVCGPTLDSEQPVSWTPIGTSEENAYTGNFNGQNFKISGLYIDDSTANYQGLFGYVGSGGIVQNLSVTGTVSGNRYVGGVVGYNRGSVENCYNTGAVSGSGWYVGGVVGDNSGSNGVVENCYNTGTVTGTDDYVGGVVGYNSSIVENCYNTDTVTGNNFVGGVVGDNGGSVKNCYNTGEVSDNSYVGGVVGNNISSVTNCYFLKTADVNKNLSGIGSGTGTATEKDNTAFHSGEVAWRLQDGQKAAGEEDPIPQVWGQSKLGETTSLPTLVALDKDAKPVYKVAFISDDTEIEAQYANSGMTVTPPEEPKKTNHLFGGWFNNGELTGDPVTGTISVTGNATYTAKWTPFSYTLSATPSALDFGSITEGEERPAAQTVTVKNTGNQTVTLKQPTAENFEIGALSVNELKPDESATFTIQPKDNLSRGSYSEQIAISNTNGEKATITATFTVKEPPYTGKYSYEVFTSVGDNGALSVDRYATEGDKVTIDVTPDQAYKLDDLSVTANGKDVELTAYSDGTYSFTMPSADVRITATFAEDPDWTPDEPEEPTTDVSDIFLDVAPDAWYKDAIQYAYDNGLMTGVSATEFAPEQTTTRAMIVSILARLEGVTTAQAAGFADVDDEWYATAVNWAANVGVVNGYEDNTFRPNTAITREQLAAILMNYAAYKGEDVSNRADLTSYTDQPSTWAEETMSWAVAEGLISGVTADTLQPQGAATRAQVAAILQRFLSE